MAPSADLSKVEHLKVDLAGDAPPPEKDWGLIFKIKIICFACLIWIIVTSFAPAPVGLLKPSDEIAETEWSNGCTDGISYCLCPRETVCCDNLRSMIFLGISRASAYFPYPLYMMLFLSKANNLMTALQGSVLSVWVQFPELHHVHTLAGSIAAVDAFVHSFFHLLRWGLRNDDIKLLWETQTGRAGLVALVITPFVTWPMMFPCLKKRMTFEWRKGMHMLSIVWGIALCFHAPEMQIFWLMGVPVVIYLIDAAIGLYFRTWMIESTLFFRLDSGSAMQFANPPGFELKGASYVLVLLPWISKYQWHAFSIFPHPTEENTSSLCMAAVGDWTKQLNKSIIRPTVRSAWIMGPYLSPFATAIEFDNIIALATGIGITPALALIKLYSDTRRINLIWMCRDPSLLEFFLSTVEFPKDAFTLIYYTGKKSLTLPDELPSSVFLFKGRPDLERVVTGIVHSIESQDGLPEEIVEEGKAMSSVPPLARFRIGLRRLIDIYSVSEIFNLCVELSEDRASGSTSKPGGSVSTKTAVLGLRESISGSKRQTFSKHRSSRNVKESDQKFSKLGLQAAMREFHGHHFLSGECIDVIFDALDGDKDGWIDQAEFLSATMVLYDDTMVLYDDEDGATIKDVEAGGSATIKDVEAGGSDSMVKLGVSRRGSWLTSPDNNVEDSTTHEPTKPKKRVSILSKLSNRTNRSNSASTGSTTRRNVADQRHLFGTGKKRCSGDIVDTSKDFVRNSRDIINTWQMLYCGGSAPVVKNLTNIHDEYGIDLKIEKFDW